jgi:hypothetical protein
MDSEREGVGMEDVMGLRARLGVKGVWEERKEADWHEGD